jgi:hypothetical protein
MQSIIELFKILIPAAAVLYGMYLMAQTFLQKQFEQKELDIKLKTIEITTPLRLQAYERMTLFLERITPAKLLIRLGSPDIHSIDYQQILLQEIREEFNHNLTQQVYISHETWQKTCIAMNDVVALINTSASEISSDSTSINLSKKIFEKVISENKQLTDEALKTLKEEAQKMFFIKH